MRLFVAVEVPRPGEEPGTPGTPTAPEHLTLRFLGEVSSDRLPAIRAALEPVGRSTPPFDIALEGVGAFPSPVNPRVVWVGVTDGREAVSALADRVTAALDEVFPAGARERFVPHLTLFRVRSPAHRRRAADLLNGREPPPPRRTVHVGAVYLKESTLTPEGARHRTLTVFPLVGAAPRPS